uniref:DUF1642 domain-containing protein n=2 Tax=Streptococcus pluranimalium TaxID=82348 RepID=UPI003F690880
MNKQEAIKTIKHIDTLTINDRIVGQQVDMVIKNQVLDIINQIDEQQKPKVPQVAVEFYERYKDDNLDLGEWFSDFYSNEAMEDFPRMEELAEWLHGNDNETNRQREFALATLVTLGIDAVEVEKEKLYTVEIPNPNTDAVTCLARDEETGKIVIDCLWEMDEVKNGWKLDNDCHLTESEIKEDFEWAWQEKFAKEVEG